MLEPNEVFEPRIAEFLRTVYRTFLAGNRIVGFPLNLLSTGPAYRARNPAELAYALAALTTVADPGGHLR